MEELMKDLGIFRREFRYIQDVSDGIKTSIYFIKYDLKTSNKNIMSENINNKKLFRLNSNGIIVLTMNTIEKIDRERNAAS